MITADTNVFVYAFDDNEPLKQSTAEQITDRLCAVGAPVALQLVGEMQNALRRKLRMDAWSAAEAARYVLRAYPTFPPSKEAVELALAQVASGSLSYWDALMLASAREKGCTAILTEDMQNGARIFGLEIVNPFAPDGISPRATELLNVT